MSAQGLLIVAGGLLLLGSTVVLVRSRLLSIRYGLGWSVAGLLAVLGAPVLEVLSGSVQDLGFTATGFSLGVFIVCLALICIQLSISVSGMQRIAQDLGEYGALLEQRVASLERELGERAPAVPAGEEDPSVGRVEGRA